MPEHDWFNTQNYDGQISCPIWETEAYLDTNALGDRRAIYSPRAGGFFHLSGTAEAILKQNPLSENAAIKATDWIIEQNRQGKMPMIASDSFQNFLEGLEDTTRDIERRAKNLLKMLDERSPHLGTQIPRALNNSPDRFLLLAHTSSTNRSEVDFLAKMLLADGLITMQSSATGVFLPATIITPQGYNALTSMESQYKASKQVFVAMWFGDTIRPFYDNGIAPAIKDCGFAPFRIDGKEHNNKIDDEIIKEIKASKFLIADFTAEIIQKSQVEGEENDERIYLGRGGVYYEAGFAHGLGIPVIWTCREDCIDHVHFDTRQYNHITYSTAEDLRKKLRNRIKATIQ